MARWRLPHKADRWHKQAGTSAAMGNIETMSTHQGLKTNTPYRSTAKEMERLDAVAVENGLAIHQMMELAGWHMVALFKVQRIKKTARVAVVCGVGNKGGDGLSAARHLVNNGYTNVSVVLIKRALKRDPTHHLNLLTRMKVPVAYFNEAKSMEWVAHADIIIDALIGYHLNGAPRGAFADAIEAVNSAPAKVIAYDMPTGLDATHGICTGTCINAYATLTLALPKRGLFSEEGKRHSGRIFLADIGIPAFLYDKVRKGSRPAFSNGIMRIP